MDNPFDSPKLMIEGAKEHIAALEKGIEAFIGEDNWTLITDVDPQTGDHILKVEFKTDVPAKLSMEAVNAAGKLRSALDHAAYASARLTGGLDDPKKTKFPFGDTLSDLEGEIKRGRCKDMHDDVVAVMLALKPYEAGNRPLWALNKMRNRSDHRVLSPCNAGVSETAFYGSISGTFSGMSEWKSTRRQYSFMRVSKDGKFNVGIKPSLTIRLNPIFDFPPRESAVHVLNNLTSEIEGIVQLIEAETLRLAAARP